MKTEVGPTYLFDPSVRDWGYYLRCALSCHIYVCRAYESYSAATRSSYQGAESDQVVWGLKFQL